jgi:hypothetical protein
LRILDSLESAFLSHSCYIPRMTQGPQNPGEKLLSYFAYEHLPTDLREVSKLYADLAHEVYHRLPGSAESTTALRKLLESKDCAVRSALDLRARD